MRNQQLAITIQTKDRYQPIRNSGPRASRPPDNAIVPRLRLVPPARPIHRTHPGNACANSARSDAPAEKDEAPGGSPPPAGNPPPPPPPGNRGPKQCEDRNRQHEDPKE